MNYTYKQIDNGDWVLTVFTENGVIMFILSSDIIGDEENPPRGLPEHVQMIQDFQDSSKLEYFIQLLIDNPGTAFTIYLGLNLGS